MHTETWFGDSKGEKTHIMQLDTEGCHSDPLEWMVSAGGHFVIDHSEQVQCLDPF